MSTLRDRVRAGLTEAGSAKESGGAELRHKGGPHPLDDALLGQPVSVDSTAANFTAPTTTIVVIHRRTLMRECLVRALRTLVVARIVAYHSVEDWFADAEVGAPSVLLFCLSNGADDWERLHQAAALVRDNTRVPLIVVGETEEPDQIIDILQCGARGYIPTDLPLSITIQALRLVTEGGVFVPASSLIAAHRQPRAGSETAPPELEMFTARQAAVVKALCRGKANKVIAYELNMCESTVKVHVRNIMKKLKAKNRTEVAIMFRSISNAEADSGSAMVQQSA